MTKEIKVENQTKEDVEVKDETGEVTTMVGSGFDVQVTLVPTPPPSTGTGTPRTGTINIALQAHAYRGENPAENDSITYTWSMGDNAIASNASENSKIYTVATIDLAALDAEQSFTVSVTVAEKDTAQTTK